MVTIQNKHQHESLLAGYLLNAEPTVVDRIPPLIGRSVGLLMQLSPEESLIDNQYVDFWDGYQKYVVSLPPDVYEIQLLKAQLLSRYESMGVARLDKDRDPSSFTACIGHESMYSEVHKVTIGGKDYALRVVGDGDINELDKHLEAGVRVAGIGHMEHILAASYVDSKTLAPYVYGRSVYDLDNFDTITEAQISELYVDMKLAEVRGVGFDFGGDNILYNPADGFTIIDLGMADGVTYLGAEGAIMTLVDILAHEEKYNISGVDRFLKAMANVICDHTIRGQEIDFIEDAIRHRLATVKLT